MRARPVPIFFIALGVVSLTVAGSAQIVPEGYSLQTVPRVYQSPSPYPDRSEGLRTEIDIPGALFLQLHFEYAEFETNFDALRILDGNGLLVEELTGNLRDHVTPTIKGSRAFLDIYSDYSTNGRGFRVDRIQACLPIAGRAPQPVPPPITTPAGPPRWVESPVNVASPSPYPSNLFREVFPVVVEGAQAIKLYFEFVDVEAEFDFCDLLDGAGIQLQRYTGRHEGFWTNEIEGDRAGVALTSDFSVQGRGFRVTRVAALMPGARSTPPAHGQLAELRYFLGGPQAQQPVPLGQGVIQLKPLGQSPDGFVLIVRAFDAYGREIDTSLIDLRPEITGDIGTCRETGPGQFLFAAGTRGGASGTLGFAVPGFAGSIPAVQIAVAGGDGHGRGHESPRFLQGLQATVTDSSGRPFPQAGNLYALEIGHRELDRAHVTVTGIDSEGRIVALVAPVQYSVRAPSRVLSVLQRPDGSLEVIAGDTPLEHGLVEIFIQAPGGRRVSTQLAFRVEPPVPVLARLDVALVGGAGPDLRTSGLELLAGTAPVEVIVSPFDRDGRPFLPPDLRILAVINGDPVVTVRDLGECRFGIATLGASGRADIVFRDGSQTVQSAPVHVSVRLPAYHHSALFIQQGRRFVPLDAQVLELTPAGLGLDSCVILVRNFDELGRVMPPASFQPQVLVIGEGGGRGRHGGGRQRAVRVEDLGDNRFRLTSLESEAVDGLALLVREPGERHGRGRSEGILRLPLRLVRPVPVLTSVRILESAPQPADLTGTHVQIPLTANGAPGYLDVEVAVYDQFGRKIEGAVIEPVFSFPRGSSPVLARPLSAVPSVWRLEPRGTEEPPCAVDVVLRGTRLSASLQVSVYDSDMVIVGSQRAEGWVKWGLNRDYDFALAQPLQRTRVVRVSTSGRLRVEKVFVQLDTGAWTLVPGVQASLEAGQFFRFELPPSKNSIRAIRIHGHSDPGCAISLGVRKPQVMRGGRGEREERGGRGGR